jgi:hypothetical protein
MTFFSFEQEIADALLADFMHTISGTNNRIQRINTVYANLLAEQKKKTLDSLYLETELADKAVEAANLFKAGDYIKANALYTLIAKEQPENTSMRFYQLYTLFLINKVDRENYPLIKHGFSILEKNGYTRPEIKAVLDFINLEESGVAGPG